MDIIIASLRRKRKNVYCLYIAYVFCLAACIVAFYFQQALASFAVVLCLLFYFFIVRSSIKQYKTQARENCIKWNMEKSLTNTELNPLPKVNIDEINMWKLLPPAKKGGYLIRDYVTGKASDVDFSLFDLTIQNNLGSAGKPTFYSGVWCVATLPEDAGINIRLWDPKLYEFKQGSASEISENPNGLIVKNYTEIPLTDELESLFCELKKYTTGQLCAGIYGNKMCFFIRNRFLSGKDVSLRTPISEEFINSDCFPEFERIKRIVQIAANRYKPACYKSASAPHRAWGIV